MTFSSAAEECVSSNATSDVQLITADQHAAKVSGAAYMEIFPQSGALPAML